MQIQKYDKWYAVFAKKPFTWIELAGSLASIITFAQGYYKLSFLVLATFLLVMTIVGAIYYERSRKLKTEVRSLRKCHSELHDIIHKTRDILLSENLLTIPRNSSDWIFLIRRALTGIEMCFKEITCADCHASIMLPDATNPEKIKTTIRSLAEKEDRDDYQTELLIGHGLAGLAFATGKSQFSTNFVGDNRFLTVRPNCHELYISGISSPFKVNEKVYGVVNLDCETEYSFDDSCTFLLRSVADFIGLIYQLQICNR